MFLDYKRLLFLLLYYISKKYIVTLEIGLLNHLKYAIPVLKFHYN